MVSFRKKGSEALNPDNTYFANKKKTITLKCFLIFYFCLPKFKDFQVLTGEIGKIDAAGGKNHKCIFKLRNHFFLSFSKCYQKNPKGNWDKMII